MQNCADQLRILPVRCHLYSAMAEVRHNVANWHSSARAAICDGTDDTADCFLYRFDRISFERVERRDSASNKHEKNIRGARDRRQYRADEYNQVLQKCSSAFVDSRTEV